MTVRLAPKTVACIKDLKYSVRKFQKVSAGAVEFSNDNNLLERIWVVIETGAKYLYQFGPLIW